nr:hypothetical protein [bacterium]
MTKGILSGITTKCRGWTCPLAMRTRLKHASWVFARSILLIGLSYIVLSPVLFMLSMSFRVPWDNMDPSVVWIPRSLTF